MSPLSAHDHKTLRQNVFDKDSLGDVKTVAQRKQTHFLHVLTTAPGPGPFTMFSGDPQGMIHIDRPCQDS